MKKKILTQILTLGDVNCALSTLEKDVHEGIRQAFKDFQSEGPADVRLELDIIGRLREDEVVAAREAETIIETSPDIAGIFHPNPDDPACVRLTMLKRYLHKKTGYKIVNLVLPRAYYTATRIRHDVSAMFVHSSAIMRDSGVFLFCGPSETGKTTVARSCQSENGLVLNDEMNLLQALSSPGDAPKCFGLPIVGGIPERRNTGARLACIINLKQSKTTAYRVIDKADAYLRFMKQIITPKDFLPQQQDVPVILKRNSEFAERIIGAVPCCEMEFTLDREEFWKEIEKLETDLITGNNRAQVAPRG